MLAGLVLRPGLILVVAGGAELFTGVTLGNAIGGGLLVGGVYWLVDLRPRPQRPANARPRHSLSSPR